MYSALYTKTNFSFLEGASHAEELVEMASQLGLSSIAVTDRDGVYGIVEAHVRARELGVRLIIGAEISVDEHPETSAIEAMKQASVRLFTIG